MEQAMRMFVAQGVKGVRMDDIAQQLGMSKRTLYEMFGDKEELLYLAVKRYMDIHFEEHDRITQGGGNVLESLFLLLNHVVDNTEESARLSTGMRRFYPAVHDRLLADGEERQHRCMAEMLRRGMDEKLFIDNIDIELAVITMHHLATVLGGTREMKIPDGMTANEAMLQIICTFFRGIATVQGIAMIDQYMEKHLKRK
ncbi:MAG: TetR/AcrR family transcriptional regulator [Alistipes sp.]|nr:TetR/AcrR family transcriptional regulator [Alistipes sp.]